MQHAGRLRLGERALELAHPRLETLRRLAKRRFFAGERVLGALGVALALRRLLRRRVRRDLQRGVQRARLAQLSLLLVYNPGVGVVHRQRARPVLRLRRLRDGFRKPRLRLAQPFPQTLGTPPLLGSLADLRLQLLDRRGDGRITDLERLFQHRHLRDEFIPPFALRLTVGVGALQPRGDGFVFARAVRERFSQTRHLLVVLLQPRVRVAQRLLRLRTALTFRQARVALARDHELLLAQRRRQREHAVSSHVAIARLRLRHLLAPAPPPLVVPVGGQCDVRFRVMPIRRAERGPRGAGHAGRGRRRRARGCGRVEPERPARHVNASFLGHLLVQPPHEFRLEPDGGHAPLRERRAELCHLHLRGRCHRHRGRAAECPAGLPLFPGRCRVVLDENARPPRVTIDCRSKAPGCIFL